MSKKVTRESKLSRYLKAPIRILMKAGDLYITSMTEYSERIGFGTVMGCPTDQVNGLSRTYSIASTKSRNGDDDLRELIRAASSRSLRDKAPMDLLGKQPGRRSPTTGANRMARNHGVGFGRIDEDKPCDFDDIEDRINVKTDVFPRSRSYAVTKKKPIFF
ncbi:ARM repeat superfamily protein isoform 1 [Hibiscus syriacus]|uniref:ARM repeat superfamily protein isoform 1 n=1 Tax=Hibiscus syriacus TaxID=106335 RepID=A0A6A3AY24_HIBSY|nr:uncharacterized protein LOC120119083 [Hibiscus syriacus]KAE8709580.1 ARM repeat superfamily protein isoform 1 [Hibiscus syriacus]